MSNEGYPTQEETVYEGQGIDPEVVAAFAIGEEGFPEIPNHVEVNNPEELPLEALEQYRSTNPSE